MRLYSAYVIKTAHLSFWFTVVFYNLLSKYGAETGQSGATNIVKLPLAFVRSGWVNVESGAVWYVGNSGYGWSRTAKSSTTAYFLGMNPTVVDPSGNNHRWVSLPLRCLYPGK